MTLQQKVPEAELVRSEYIRCEFRSGAKLNDAKVQRCLRQLQKVPESLQEIIAKEGVYIVFLMVQ